MRVVDIQANWAEQILHPGVVGINAVDEVLVSATNYHLKGIKKHNCINTR